MADRCSSKGDSDGQHERARSYDPALPGVDGADGARRGRKVRCVETCEVFASIRDAARALGADRNEAEADVAAGRKTAGYTLVTEREEDYESRQAR